MNLLWRIEMFGELRARRGAQCVRRFGTQKNALLLARLAFPPAAAQSREKLIDWLWADAEPSQGRNNLSVALRSLRKILAPADSLIAADRRQIRFKPENFTTDAAAFLGAVEAARRAADSNQKIASLEQAAALYAGEFLAGFYDDWALRERASLQKIFLETIAALRDLNAERGEIRTALGHARQICEIDNFDEPARRELMRLMARTGDKNAALGEFRELERILQNELGIAPEAETRRLVEQIKQNKFAAAPAPIAVSSFDLFPAAKNDSLAVFPTTETRYFGREREIAEICELLRANRLVTVTGAGGMGKTRLALEAARRLAPAFNDSVWFVPLADVPTAAFLAEAVRAALRLERDAKIHLFEQIAAAIGSKPALLILDNFEQIVDEGTNLVKKLLAAAPGLRCFVTSRRLLSIADEIEFALAPLPVPPQMPPSDKIDLAAFPSVELFLDRARRVRRDFQISPEIYELCRRLEGIPLALELVAARAASLSAREMLAKLDARLDFFQNRRRDAVLRQRTLRATLDYSFDLLDQRQRDFFVRLAVFSGNWNAAQAAALAENAADAHDLLEDLRASSLIANLERDGEIYWSMLETVREYATEKLTQKFDENEILTIRRRHAEIFLEIAERAEREFWREGQTVWLGRLDAQIENLRAAMRFALDTRNADLSLRFGAALRRFWTIRGLFAEGREFLENALRFDDWARKKSAFRPKALVAAGIVARMQGDFARAGDFLKAALKFLRRSPDAAHDLIKASGNLGIVFALQNKPARARKTLEKSLALARASGNERLLGGAFVNLGFIEFNSQNYDAAGDYNLQALDLYRKIGDRAAQVLTLLNLAEILQFQNKDDAATRFLTESLRINRELNYSLGAANSLYLLGESAMRQNRFEQAAQFFAESLEIRQKIGDKRGSIAVLEASALLSVRQGNAPRGLRFLREAKNLRQSAAIAPTTGEGQRIAQILKLAAENQAQIEIEKFIS